TWKEIRDPAKKVPRSGSIFCSVADRRTLRDLSCWIPDLLPLTLQSSGKGGRPTMGREADRRATELVSWTVLQRDRDGL
ncbi:hypothetical protein SQ03_21050, partial [Methylobacterium platani JCM 14648]